ncbi:transmembrane protein 45B-like [Glandiceps talaboti]
MVVNLYHWREDCPLKGASIGHATPGVIFVILGVWWAGKYAYRFKSGNSERGRQCLETLCRRGPLKKLSILCRFSVEFWEGLVVLATAVIGFFGEQSIPYMKWEMFNSTDADGVFIHGDEWQHCTMYTFFGIYGAAVVLARTLVTGLEPYEMFFGALAFFVEGMLFYFHVQGRNTHLDVVTHMMLVIAASGCSFFSLLEVWMPKDKLVPFLRSGSTILQGTWLLQIASMLSKQWVDKCAPWEDTHANVMFVTMAFCWHIVAVIIILGVIVGTVSLFLRIRRNHTSIAQYATLTQKVESDDEAAIKLLNSDVL